MRRAIEAWSSVPEIEVLGNLDAERLSILSFVVRRPGGRYLHHNVVVALLNDLFGIQARGGCSCAGPYGHRLLGIDIERSHEYERAITAGCEGIKPGWVRVNFNYFIDEEVFEYVVRAIAFVASHGHALPRRLHLRPRHRSLAPSRRAGRRAPLRLTDLGYDADGRAHAASRSPNVPTPRCSREYLAEAERLPERTRTSRTDDASGDAHVTDDFDALRWFELPADCSCAVASAWPAADRTRVRRGQDAGALVARAPRWRCHAGRTGRPTAPWPRSDRASSNHTDRASARQVLPSDGVLAHVREVLTGRLARATTASCRSARRTRSTVASCATPSSSPTPGSVPETVFRTSRGRRRACRARPCRGRSTATRRRRRRSPTTWARWARLPTTPVEVVRHDPDAVCLARRDAA